MARPALPSAAPALTRGAAVVGAAVLLGALCTAVAHAQAVDATRDASAAQPRDVQAVARNLVRAAMVRPGDKVLVSGSTRDAGLMEEVAVEVMKVGGQPLLTLGSERLIRRSYDDVPASYDTMPPTLGVTIADAFDAQISVDVIQTDGFLAGVPQARRAARAKAAEPANQAFFRSDLRSVNLGNGLYPTQTLAQRLGIPQSQLADVFWKAASVPASTLRERGAALQSVFANARQVTVTHPNGTNVTFAVDPSRGFVSDGAITPEKAAQGSAAASTWLPAGELILPATAGSATGKVVIDRMLWDGKEVRGLTLTFQNGRLTSMTAASGLEPLKAAYDAAGAGKDQFGYIDIGINPETRLPVGTGRIVWSAPGSVVLGLGDNRGFGGTNASDFGMSPQLGGATVKAGNTVVVDKGTLVTPQQLAR